MKMYVAGGCCEHGRNCFLIKTDHLSFLVDAGIMRTDSADPYPSLSEEQIKSLDYVFFTHCHGDHTGAALWLYEKGFRGRMAASRFTFENIPGMRGNFLVLEELGTAGEPIELPGGLSIVWGRSGHCIGGVWFLFSIEGRRMLFTGDYCEKTVAYRRDRIRGISADLAVIDCAYGTQKGSGSENRLAFYNLVEECIAARQVMFFPVPSHGRGLDIIRAMVERGVPVYADKRQIEEIRSVPDAEFYLRRKLRKATDREVMPLSEYPVMLFSPEKKAAHAGPLPFGALVVSDTQLSDHKNRDAALAVRDAGGRIILTGKHNEGSFSRMLIETGQATFSRISVHQNIDDLEHLVRKNSFRVVIPYHSAEEMKTDDPLYRILHRGETIEIE